MATSTPLRLTINRSWSAKYIPLPLGGQCQLNEAIDSSVSRFEVVDGTANMRIVVTCQSKDNPAYKYPLRSFSWTKEEVVAKVRADPRVLKVVEDALIAAGNDLEFYTANRGAPKADK